MWFINSKVLRIWRNMPFSRQICSDGVNTAVNRLGSIGLI